MPKRKYYEAYDERYRHIHDQNLIWFNNNPSPIVADTLREFSISNKHKLLEIGCGEGRDAYPLFEQGYNLLATDVSSAVISFCRKKKPDYAAHFQTLSCSDLLSSIVCELFHILSSCCFKGVFKGFAETVPGIGHSVIRGFSDNHLPQVNGPPRALLSCNANHEVCVSMGLAQMAQTWSVIKTLGNALNIVISFSACSLLVLLLSCLPHVYVIGHHAPDKTG